MERTRLDVYEKLPSGMEKYLAEHGWNFSKKLCEYAVSKMKDRSGNKIHPYDKDQVETLMKQFNVELKNDVEYNKVYVLNMVRADYMGSSIVNEQYACMFVKDYLDDVDGSPTRALDEYYAKCIACGTPFSWEDYI